MSLGFHLKWLIKFRLQVCDLSSVSEIKSFTSRFSSKDVPIHVLVRCFFVVVVFSPFSNIM